MSAGGAADVSVPHAARHLRVNQQRVRAMIVAGALDARKVAGRWLVDRDSLARIKGAERPRGRTFAPANAWAILLAATSPGVPHPYLDHITPPARSRARSWARTANLLDLAPRLRGRARVLRLRAHPSDVARVAGEPGLVRTGVSAAADHHFDIAAPGVVELYVPAKTADGLIRKYALSPSASPNVLLRVIDGEWPFDRDQRVAPGPVAALDLVDADDERTRRAGREYLARLAHP